MFGSCEVTPLSVMPLDMFFFARFPVCVHPLIASVVCPVIARLCSNCTETHSDDQDIVHPVPHVVSASELLREGSDANVVTPELTDNSHEIGDLLIQVAGVCPSVSSALRGSLRCVR